MDQIATILVLYILVNGKIVPNSIVTTTEANRKNLNYTILSSRLAYSSIAKEHFPWFIFKIILHDTTLNTFTSSLLLPGVNFNHKVVLKPLNGRLRDVQSRIPGDE